MGGGSVSVSVFSHALYALYTRTYQLAPMDVAVPMLDNIFQLSHNWCCLLDR